MHRELCSKCGEPVRILYITKKEINVIEPCKKCLKKEYDKGYEDGGKQCQTKTVNHGRLSKST